MQLNAAGVTAFTYKCDEAIGADIGGPLFHRDRKNIELTELGRVVKPYLKQVNECASEAKRKAGKLLAMRSVKSSQPRAMGVFMRAHHIITVVAILVIGLGSKQFLFPPKQANADINAVPSASVNVLQMHRNADTKSLPVQKINDKTFIFTDEE